MAVRCQLLLRGGLGLVLPDLGVARLLALDPGLVPEARHDRRLVQRRGGVGGGVYGHEERAGGAPGTAADRSRLELSVRDLRAVPASGAEPRYLLRPAPPLVQQQSNTAVVLR